jgi:hypothetical protein
MNHSNKKIPDTLMESIRAAVAQQSEEAKALVKPLPSHGNPPHTQFTAQAPLMSQIKDEEPAPLRVNIDDDKQSNATNRTILAVIVCFLIVVAYVALGVFMGWKRNGGLIPMIVLLAVLRFVWKKIRRVNLKPIL